MKEAFKMANPNRRSKKSNSNRNEGVKKSLGDEKD